MREAAYNAAAELAFVAPDVFTDLLIQQMQEDLNPDQLEGIGPVEAAIFRTPAGIAVVDVLAQKEPKQLTTKNVKDYDTLRWEEELRAQLAQRKGTTKKLTSDEQSQVDAQLVKEATVRETLVEVDIKLRRGVGIIQSLALGPPTEAERWMGPAVTYLLAVISRGAGLLVGKLASEAYLACSEQLTRRLGTLRRSIGSATLRSLPSVHLPSELEEEPIGGNASHGPCMITY